MIKIIILLLVLTLPLAAQIEDRGIKAPPKGSLPAFFFDAYNYRGPVPGKTRVDFYFEIPYEGIQFVKTAYGFAGSYTITVSFFDESKEKLLTEKSWTETIAVKDFESTASKKNFKLSYRSFDLAPANYFVRCEVEDKDSKKNIIKESMFTVRNMSHGLDISDVLLISQMKIVDGDQKMIPNISRNVAARKEGINVNYEIYSDTARLVNLQYGINDSKGKNIFNQEIEFTLQKEVNIINFTLSNPELNMGEYDLIVNVADQGGKSLAAVSKKFFSRWIGLPTAVQDLDKAVDQLVYIAKESELDKIKQAQSKSEKLKLYLDFWKSKDPNPATEENEAFEEYYRRINFANEHFKNYLEGWRTDMGMVYITLGAPNNVERYPFEEDSKPYEVWDYYDINKRFVFVDQTGFGDYRLSNPSYGNWWKYRP